MTPVDLTAVTFWICAPLMVVLALVMVLARKAVHSALCLAGIMVALGVLYASLSAPFLFVAQLIVYTGSVMMLFLFTMMLIGVDTADQAREVIRGQRVASIVLALGVAGLLGFTVLHAIVGQPVGLDDVNRQYGGNAQAVAQVLFGRYAVAFEAASALVITAALAAMVLAHADKPTPKERQRERVDRRLRLYASDGVPPTPEPSSGVYARHNATTYPALLPDGQPAPQSVPKSLTDRGQAVVGDPLLKRPAQAMHNLLAVQAAALDGRPALLADLPELLPAVGSEVDPVGPESDLTGVVAPPEGIGQTDSPAQKAPLQPKRGQS